ncbi:hypothetical protein M378DRAFT_76530 [Amanita muscaria Koide BX008]|uniref:CENP-V/GFA domain-containing protein n=1 Tax=Amanita muscaria (strain Koide BX008) TaxID=946122 RepID=A0A0C2WVF5_AMAMK|nr:hypothetical protein M378DRAFT_76530 [Amanita muscaria Koide BX008]
MPGSTTIRSASCLCNAVKFDVEGEPISFRLCHCSNCQKHSGSVFMSPVFFKTANVHIKQGKDCIKQFEDKSTISGTSLLRSYCEKCGSNLFLQTPGDAVIGVLVGAVDDTHDWSK